MSEMLVGILSETGKNKANHLLRCSDLLPQKGKKFQEAYKVFRQKGEL